MVPHDESMNGLPGTKHLCWQTAVCVGCLHRKQVEQLATSYLCGCVLRAGWCAFHPLLGSLTSWAAPCFVCSCMQLYVWLGRVTRAKVVAGCVHMLTKSLHTRLWISPGNALSNGSCLVSSLPLHMDLLQLSSSNVTEAVIVAQPEQMMHVVPRPACFAVGALQQQPAVAELA